MGTKRRQPVYPETETQLKKWRDSRLKARKHVEIDNPHNPSQQIFKRKPLDCWEFVDNMGLTLEEFRLLYAVANAERWNKGKKNDKSEFVNGCYMSGESIANRTGLSKSKVYETLKILTSAKIIEKIGRRPQRTKNGRAFAGASHEYRIAAFSQWVEPPELAQIRQLVKPKQK